MATVQPPENPVRPAHLAEAEPSSYERTLYFVEDNRKLLLGIVGGIVLLALLVVAFLAWRSSQSDKAAAALAAPVELYEQGQYEQALADQGDQKGLLSLADDYGSTAEGNLAHYYAGDALYRLGRLDEALEQFEAYDGDDTFLEAGALAGQAAIHESRDNFARAAALYREAADAYPNPSVAPGYYLGALRNYARAGNADEAQAIYQILQSRFADAPEVQDAEYYLGQLDAGAGA